MFPPPEKENFLVCLTPMPAALFVPVSFFRITFFSHTVTELALPQQRLHCPAGEA